MHACVRASVCSFVFFLLLFSCAFLLLLHGTAVLTCIAGIRPDLPTDAYFIPVVDIGFALVNNLFFVASFLLCVHQL